ncbi:MAG: hypothetical protein AAF098_03005 [Pseudomonadota bacterium]
MTELTYLVRKRSDLDETQFLSACERYEAFLRASAIALGIKDICVQQKMNTICQKCFAISRKLEEPAFDAQIKMSWDTMDDYIDGAGSPTGIAAMDALVVEEKKFIDLGKSQAFFLDKEIKRTADNTAESGSQTISS